jgi:NB-ARC domain
MTGLADSSGDRVNSIKVEGDRNQLIGQVNGGNVFGNVGRDVVINQPQPKFLSLHQLPSDIADFTGRTTEIETIHQQLLGGKSLVISAVAGMAGVGKSALAIHVAQQLAVADYPDVQLYVDLRGVDGDGLKPGDVLARWLRAFGLDESNMPIDLQERASVYRSQLAGKRAIVLLDNARDEAQVRPLLPGSGCAVIITSRRVLGALDGATVLNLKVLSDPEARDLLAKLVGVERLEAEPDAAAVVQESEHPVIEGIERLIDAQLLEVNADRRYRFHDLLRLFAREKLAGSISVEEQEGIKQQIVDCGVSNNLM